MFIQTFLVNLFFLIVSCRKRYRTGGRAGAGVGKVTQTFGKGVATLIKDIKQGNWGDDELGEQYDERTGNRFIDDSKYYESIGNDTQFYVIVVCVTILIVAAILYFIIKVLPNMNQKNTHQEMRKRNSQRFKHYEALKCIAENGIHPDKAYGRLQKIKYK